MQAKPPPIVPIVLGCLLCGGLVALSLLWANINHPTIWFFLVSAGAMFGAFAGAMLDILFNGKGR